MAGHAAAFIGRGHELRGLIEIGESVARRSGPAAAIVEGDPGSGKSRLIEEASARVALRNTLHVVGFEPARQVPLAAASDLLRALCRAPRDGARLRRLLYEMPEAPSGLESLRLFEAVHRALSSIGPSLIVADDLQWADEQTLALFHYLMRAAQALAQPLGLIVGSRPGPNADRIIAAFQQLLPPRAFSVLRLEPLSQEEGVLLALELAPELLRDEAEALWARSHGSPFWIEILTRNTDTYGDADTVVSGRLRGIGTDAIELFALLAVVGRPMMPRDLALLLRSHTDQVDFAIAQLSNRGLAVQRGGDLGRQRWRHAVNLGRAHRGRTRVGGRRADCHSTS